MRDQTKCVDLKQVNHVLLQPHWHNDADFLPAARLRPSSATTIPVTNHDRSPVKSQKPYDVNCAIRYDGKKVRNS